MFGLLVLCTTSLLAVARAANCNTSPSLIPYDEQAWDLRQQICGDLVCYDEWEETGDKTSCSMNMPLGGQWWVSANVSDSTSGYANCWNALGNIIEQCFEHGKYDSGVKLYQGWWQDGSEYYIMSIVYDDGYYDLVDVGFGDDGVLTDALEASEAPPVNVASPR